MLNFKKSLKSIVKFSRYDFRIMVIAVMVFDLFGQSVSESYVDKEFFDDFTGTSVSKTDWRIATWKEHGGQTGTDRCFTKDGFLTMLFINDSAQGFLSSAIETKNEFLFGRWEARIKPSNVPGVLNSFFTIDWDNTSLSGATNDGTKQEIDIEFLTFAFAQNSGKVHFAVHMEGKKSFETNPDVEVKFNPSEDFHVWGFEITPDKIEWFVDSIVLKQYIYKDNDFPITSPYQIKLNCWSAEKWINGPPQKNVTCTYLIDWIRFTPMEKTSVHEKRLGEFHNRLLANHNDLSVKSTGTFNLKGQIVEMPGSGLMQRLMLVKNDKMINPLKVNRQPE